MSSASSDRYEAALRRLLRVPSSPRLGLERMESLLARLGNPHRAFHAIHVAGTNGKGSTCAFLDSLLGAQGIRRGLTTSPHLTSARERIRIEGEPISEARFLELEARVAEAADALEDAPTFFERVIAMAFLAFQEARVEVAIVEVGLGGRLDATNVITPLAAGITRLGLDHQAFLGDTLAAVAGEKAGILKPGVPARSAPQEPEAAEVIRARAAAIGAPFRVVDARDLDRVAGRPLGFSGPHQQENAALAVALLDAAGLSPDESALARGLAEARWPGRYETLAADPLLIADGAHNPLGAKALVRALSEDPRTRDRPRFLVVGMTRGHGGEDFARELSRLSPALVLTVRARAPRSRPADEVAQELSAGGLPATPRAEVEAALEEARALAADRGGVVVVTGSLYLVGEVRARFVDVDVDPELPDF